MLRKILRWLGLAIDDRALAQLSPEGQAMIARLDQMYDDIFRLTYEDWQAKWRPDEPMR